MISPRTSLRVVIAILAFTPLGFSSATDVYVTPNGSPVSGSVCTTNTQTPAWFNSSANWGSGAAQIGPGTTVHLCGTFSMPAGAGGTLTAQGSGTNNNFITIRFESGANATAPYWGTGGFINSAGHNYIVVDGGTNGTIQATANGAALTYNTAGNGIVMDGSSNSEVKNLTIANMYVPVANNNKEDGNNSYAIHWLYGSNVTIDNNTTSDCRWCIQYWYQGSGTSQNISIYNNTVYNTDHCLMIGDGDSGAILQGTNLMYGNTCYGGWQLWDTPGGGNHHDGIHVWAVHAGSQITDLKIYNNYIYGDLGQTSTAYIYIDLENGNAQTSITTEIFNNVVVNTSSTDAISTGAGGDGLLFCQGSTCNIYNNTFVGATTGGCCNNVAVQTESTTSTPNVTLNNNVYSTLALAMDISEGGIVSASDYNDYYNLGSGAVRTSAAIDSFAQWQASAGKPDAHSTTNNPNLSATYTLDSGSAAIGAATNQTSLGIIPLDSDKAGVGRAATGSCTPGVPGCWDAGAYQYPTNVTPPTGLTATVQ